MIKHYKVAGINKLRCHFTMTALLLISFLILSSCGQNTSNQSSNLTETNNPHTDETLRNDYSDTGHKKTINSDTYEFITEQIDTTELIQFWNIAVMPIIKKDKKAVLQTIKFPLDGDWAGMTTLGKGTEELTEEDFKKVYDKIFNAEFIELLSKQTYKDIEVSTFKDTLYFAFAVGKEKDGFGSAVRFVYKKINSDYVLNLIGGAGGDFYEN